MPSGPDGLLRPAARRIRRGRHPEAVAEGPRELGSTPVPDGIGHFTNPAGSVCEELRRPAEPALPNEPLGRLAEGAPEAAVEARPADAEHASEVADAKAGVGEVILYCGASRVGEDEVQRVRRPEGGSE